MYIVDTDTVGNMSFYALEKQSAKATRWVFASLAVVVAVEAGHPYQLASAASNPAAAARRTKILHCLRRPSVLHRDALPASAVKVAAYCHCFAIAARTTASPPMAQHSSLETANSSNMLRKRPPGCSW